MDGVKWYLIMARFRCAGPAGARAKTRDPGAAPDGFTGVMKSVIVGIMSETTTITIARTTRQRLAHVKFNGKPLKTADETVAALIEEHERRQFWEAMDAIDPDEYEAQTREEGAWPTEGEYAAEEQMIRAQETTA